MHISWAIFVLLDEVNHYVVLKKLQRPNLSDPEISGGFYLLHLIALVVLGLPSGSFGFSTILNTDDFEFIYQVLVIAIAKLFGCGKYSNVPNQEFFSIIKYMIPVYNSFLLSLISQFFICCGVYLFCNSKMTIPKLWYFIDIKSRI